MLARFMASPLPSAPMDGMLSAVLEIVPDAILSGPGQEQVLRWASHFPTFALESTFGFESRLDEEPAACDLFLSAQPGSRFSRYLIRRGARAESSAAARGLGRFLVEVSAPASFLSQWFRTVILEYDLVAAPARTGPPGVFIEPHGSPLDMPGESKRTEPDRGLTCHHGVMTSAVCWATGRATDAAEQRAMGRVHRALPRAGTTDHLGALPDRAPRMVRVVFGMPRDEVVPFLERTGWTGSPDRLQRVIDGLDRRTKGVTAIALACDVSPAGVAPRVALELYTAHRWHEGRTRPWAALIEHFVEQGWCNRAKADALLSWPAGDYLLTAGGVYRLVTGINHLKLVIRGDRIAGKAYTGALLLPK